MRTAFLLLAALPVMAWGQTLGECQQAAERNYPLIQQYGLIEKTTQLTVANIGKGWLPQLSVTAQATSQNSVTAFPDAIQSLYEQAGITMEGLKRNQYRVGVDLQQTLYDGGNMRSQREVARRQGELQTRRNEVDLYPVRRRVNEMYFSLLLVDEQIKLNEDLQRLLEENEKKLASMLKNGTAALSDWQTVKAERLNVAQQTTELLSRRKAVVRMLSTFCGMEVAEAVKPSLLQPETPVRNLRPELKALDAQISLADAQEKALDAALRPQLGLFAQGYYGYPGYNMFEFMMGKRMSWNGMVGARLTWNMGALYTRRNDKAKISLQRQTAVVNRERFLFDNSMEQIEQDEKIERYRKLMAGDEEIISLRTSIRMAAESKLEHGIIDVNDLVREINNENAARVSQTMHEIEMLKEIYDLRYITNQ